MIIQYIKNENKDIQLVVNSCFISTIKPKNSEFLKKYGAEIAKAELLKKIDMLRQQYKDLKNAKNTGTLKEEEKETANNLLNIVTITGKKYAELLSQIQ